MRDGMAWNKPVIWVGCEADYFSRDDWTGQIKLKWFEKLACSRRRPNSPSGPHQRSDMRDSEKKNPGCR
jgi:hypothetical protein